MLDSNFVLFDGLDDNGYIYYPYTCLQNNGEKKCKIHFALHGCGDMLNGSYGWEWIKQGGYNEYAATNNLIIVYP